jgi:hypothetical protein
MSIEEDRVRNASVAIDQQGRRGIGFRPEPAVRDRTGIGAGAVVRESTREEPPAGPVRVPPRLGVRLRGDEGMNTAEYAVGTLAAVAFAGVLLKVVTSDAVQAALTRIVERALQ